MAKLVVDGLAVIDFQQNHGERRLVSERALQLVFEKLRDGPPFQSAGNLIFLRQSGPPLAWRLFAADHSAADDQRADHLDRGEYDYHDDERPELYGALDLVV